MTERLNNRFEITDFLGEGAQGQTHLATDHKTGETVAVKRLAVEKLDDWKSLELFEREATVLRGLDHAAIPKYIDAFHIDDDIGRHFYIAQEFVDGSDLERRLEDGERWNEGRAKQVLKELLDVLEYLHGLSPPVIHRDIKPSNIIERTDGTLALIDFGSVQHVVNSTVGGSTMSGTPGYMPLEQVMGQSVPASDLFAVGATLVRLMSRKEPSNLPLKRTAIQFENEITATPELKHVIKSLLEPAIEDRFTCVADVRIVFQDSLPAGITEHRKAFCDLLTTVIVEKQHVADGKNDTPSRGPSAKTPPPKNDLYSETANWPEAVREEKKTPRPSVTSRFIAEESVYERTPLHRFQTFWFVYDMKWWSLGFVVWLVLSFGYCHFAYERHLHMQKAGRNVVATVIDRATESDDDGTSYRLLIDYGAGRDFVGVDKETWKRLDSGSKIDVFYDPTIIDADVHIGRKEDESYGVGEVIITFGGFFFVCLGGVFWLIANA